MEEDIELLEEMKQNCLTKREYIDPKAERKAQAIENLIKGYRELEEGNKELLRLTERQREIIEKEIERNNELEINSIPKSKIQEKITQYKNQLKKLKPNDLTLEDYYDTKIEALKDLLKEK